MSLFKVENWKAAASKGISSILDVESPCLEGHGITIPPRMKGNERYSLALDLIVDGYGETGLAINTHAIIQLWHRRLGHLDKRLWEYVPA